MTTTAILFFVIFFKYFSSSATCTASVGFFCPLSTVSNWKKYSSGCLVIVVTVYVSSDWLYSQQCGEMYLALLDTIERVTSHLINFVYKCFRQIFSTLRNLERIVETLFSLMADNFLAQTAVIVFHFVGQNFYSVEVEGGTGLQNFELK